MSNRSGFWLGVVLASDDMRAVKRRRQARGAARRQHLESTLRERVVTRLVLAVVVLGFLLYLGAHLGGAR